MQQQLSINKFPRTSNPKMEFQVWHREFLAIAYRLNLHGRVHTQPEYEVLPGRQLGDIFVPLVEPQVPAANANAQLVGIYNIRDRKFKEQNDPYIALLSLFTGALDLDHLIIVGDGEHGTINKSLIQMLTPLKAKYSIFNPKEVKDMIKSLSDGSRPINLTENIETFLNHAETIHGIAARNQNTISEADKIDYVIAELAKLSNTKLDLWIAMYETNHTTMLSKDYNAFKALLLVFYPNLNHETMKSAGYIAQAKEDKTAALEAQIQKLTQQVNKLQGKHARPDEKMKTKTKGKKYCDSCKFNHSHWSNECTRRKDDHNPNSMAPV